MFASMCPSCRCTIPGGRSPSSTCSTTRPACRTIWRSITRRGADKRFVGLEDYAPAFAAQKAKFPARFAPGAKYEYQNVNYMLLALIVQRVAKKSFGTFLKDEVFNPLGMTTAFAYERPSQTRSWGTLGAVPYYADKGEYKPNRTGNEFVLTCGDGYLFASLRDLAKWDAGWRKGGWSGQTPCGWRRSDEDGRRQDGLPWVRCGPPGPTPIAVQGRVERGYADVLHLRCRDRPDDRHPVQPGRHGRGGCRFS